MNAQVDSSAPPELALEPLEISSLQRWKLGEMLRKVLPSNEFYRNKLRGVEFDARRDDVAVLPFTTRREIESDQLSHPPYGTNLTHPLNDYCRFHQTSGTGGRPVRWLDTAESWNWFKSCWGIILRAAGVTRSDRLMFPFSFGPFIGFWAAFEGASAMGCLCLPAGGMTTSARLRLLLDNSVDFVLCTPTYAMRLVETAVDEGIDLASSKVRGLIVAGEPGGSVSAMKSRIESAWGARVYDHSGMTEIGSVSYECHAAPGGVHIIESEFIPEVIDPSTGKSLPEGELGELVLTNLGRWGSPLIRYRTGDLVRLSRKRCVCGSSFARLEGGILSRVDDMLIVRGNNVFPGAVEAVVRQFPEVVEFRVRVREDAALSQVRVEIELSDGADPEQLVARMARAMQTALSFRADIQAVPRGTLPRFEMKARRFVREDKRNEI